MSAVSLERNLLFSLLTLHIQAYVGTGGKTAAARGQLIVVTALGGYETPGDLGSGLGLICRGRLGG